MSTLSNIFLVLHVLCVAAIVVLLLLQTPKEIKVIPKGLTHAGLGALVFGLAMVVVRVIQHHDHPAAYPNYNYATLAVKLLVLVYILAIAFKNAKAESITKSTWLVLLALTLINIGLAQSLK